MILLLPTVDATTSHAISISQYINLSLSLYLSISPGTCVESAMMHRQPPECQPWWNDMGATGKFLEAFLEAF